MAGGNLLSRASALGYRVNKPKTRETVKAFFIKEQSDLDALMAWHRDPSSKGVRTFVVWINLDLLPESEVIKGLERKCKILNSRTPDRYIVRDLKIIDTYDPEQMDQEPKVQEQEPYPQYPDYVVGEEYCKKWRSGNNNMNRR